MAEYDQLKPFFAKDMGNKKGLCLQNVAKGFHIFPSKDPSSSAKNDMERNKRKGTLHTDIKSIPTNCAVPVYQNTTSKYEHIVVYDRGIWYSDGKRVNKPSNLFGWGEWCNGYQIVKKGQSKGFLPAKGYWCKGDKDYRIGELCNFYAENYYGYFCKTKAQAHAKLDGTYFGDNCYKWTVKFQKNVGLTPDGCVGKLTYKELKKRGFKG